MLKKERLLKITALVEQQEVVTVNDLIKLLGVSDMTIRSFKGSVAFNPFKKSLRHGFELPDGFVDECLALLNEVKEIGRAHV